MKTASEVVTTLIHGLRISDHEVLVWNKDGFCWLRGKGGENREFKGKFPTLVDAIQECINQGYSPEGVFHI